MEIVPNPNTNLQILTHLNSMVSIPNVSNLPYSHLLITLNVINIIVYTMKLMIQMR